MLKTLKILILTALLATASVSGQTPTGTISGIVTTAAGEPVSNARLFLTKNDSGVTRKLKTSAAGDYSVTVLLPGVYTLTAEAHGFSTQERTADVRTGTTTTVNFSLLVGEISEQVTVDASAPMIQFEHHQVAGVISRNQIEDLPVNGRSFFELAKLEPGVQPPARANTNRTFVPVLGQPVGNSGRGTRVTVDGGSIMAVGNGGSSMGLSQEVVQEFQVATVNFDLTTGITNGAAINVTTRSGGNELHGSGFYFIRDHQFAAYPILNRDPADPDPFFQRRQFGFVLGGPIRQDRLYFFGNYERNEQRGVAATNLLAPEFTHLNRITPSPFFNTQLGLRLDGRLSKAHNAFVRYSHDGIWTAGPPANQANAYPSSWRRQPAWSDQSILGLTSVFRETLVNDFRFSYFYVNSTSTGVTEQECPGCMGVGAPSITVSDSDLSIGVSSTLRTVARRFHLNDYVTWQRASHRLRIGVDWEYNRGGILITNDEPVTLTLFSPQRARQANIPVPSSFRTLDDVLELPLRGVTVGIGDARVPQANRSPVRSWHTLRLFFQDTWRFNSRLTVNYGLAWSIDRNLNYDLTKPELLRPILSADGLGPTQKQWKNFSPVLGMNWTPGYDGKTVIRAGAGLFYDFLFPQYLEAERALLGPPHFGRQAITGNRLLNCLPGVPGVPVGAALNFPNNPTPFTGANLMTCLPAIRAELVQNLTNANASIQAIQLTKQASGMSPVDLPSSSALHLNFGIQQEIVRDFVIGADFVFRHFDHVGLGQLDLNHFNSARGPVIPRCLNEAQRNNPDALCSTGPINVQVNAGRVSYEGLLVRAEKRYSGGFQLLGSWAYARNTGTGTPGGDAKQPPGFNLDDWLSNRGPLVNDITHILNLAGLVQLPWSFRLGLNFSFSSAPPLSAFIGGSDFNGDGTTDDLLPGTTLNAFNRSLGRAELENIVTQFNQTYAGGLDGKGVLIPKLTLPKSYSFGDNFQSLDFRLSREFVFDDRWRLTLMGEVFNSYNAANLTGHSGNLTTIAFGQPGTRATQVFGSGGPRAFQFGARLSF